MGDIKQYTIDTNLFRHKTNKKDREDIKAAARYFWNQIEKELKNNEAVLFVPIEVVRELEVQSFTLSENQNQKIAELLEMCTEVVPINLTEDMEHSN